MLNCQGVGIIEKEKGMDLSRNPQKRRKTNWIPPASV